MSASATVRTSSPLPPAIDRFFELALYLLVLAGFGTLASTGGLDFPSVALVTLALLVRGYFLLVRQSAIMSSRWVTTLTIAYVAFYLVDYFVLSQSFLSSTVHLVLFVLVLRLFSLRRDRDAYFLGVISFLMVLAAAMLTVDTTFLLAFFGFLLIAVVTVILMEVRQAATKASVHPAWGIRAGETRQVGISLAATAPLMVVLISLGATIIFFLLPRISSGFLSGYTPTSAIATGFSDHVELGRIGEIQQSSAIVMHIRIDNDSGGNYDLKWRGVTLSVFDGNTWSNPHDAHLAPRSPDGAFLLSSVHHSTGTIHYRVLMEPLGSGVFFLAPVPLTLQGNYRFIAVDGSGQVIDPDPGHPITTYEVTSDIFRPSTSQLRAAGGDYPPRVLLEYLQVPKIDPRIPQLAEQITDKYSNNYDKAIALEWYLRTNFGYTLQLPPRHHSDPLGYFLFERKQGHCEYFASAMAVMLRTLHIPSRVVNGFRTGEFNDVTGQYLVRASNAHSWVEAYFPGYGWITFDPTPAAPAYTRSSWGRIGLYLDAMSSFWREWIVNYDTTHQAVLGRNVARDALSRFFGLQDWARGEYNSLLSGARNAQRNISDAPERWGFGTLLVIALLALAANVRRIWRAIRTHRIATHPEKAPVTAASIWYERTLKLLARRGHRKEPAQTPAEFVTSLSNESLQKSVRTLTDHYERARFGESSEDAAKLPEMYKEVSNASKN